MAEADPHYLLVAKLGRRYITSIWPIDEATGGSCLPTIEDTAELVLNRARWHKLPLALGPSLPKSRAQQLRRLAKAAGIRVID
jgi:hypothetical protein